MMMTLVGTRKIGMPTGARKRASNMSRVSGTVAFRMLNVSLIET